MLSELGLRFRGLGFLRALGANTDPEVFVYLVLSKIPNRFDPTVSEYEVLVYLVPSKIPDWSDPVVNAGFPSKQSEVAPCFCLGDLTYDV